MLLLATRAVAPRAGGLLAKDVSASSVWRASVVLATLAMGACPVGDKVVGACRVGNEGANVVLTTLEVGACPVGDKGVGACSVGVGDEGVVVVLATK